MSKHKDKKNKDVDVPKVFEIIEGEDGRLKGRIHVNLFLEKLKAFGKKLKKKLRKIWRVIKEFFIRSWYRFLFFFNPKSDRIPKHYKKMFCGSKKHKNKNKN